MTAAIAEQGLAGHPFSEAIQAQFPLDVWDLGVFGYAGGAMTARFRGRVDRAGRGATGITQRWLLGSMKEWVLRNALRRVSSSYIDDMILSVAMLSATLRERGDGGDHPDRLSRNDISAHLLRLGRLRERRVDLPVRAATRCQIRGAPAGRHPQVGIDGSGRGCPGPAGQLCGASDGLPQDHQTCHRRTE